MDACGEDDLVETAIAQIQRSYRSVETEVDPGVGEAVSEVPQGLVKFLFSGNCLGDVELATDPVGGFETCYLVSSFGGGGGGGRPGPRGPTPRWWARQWVRGQVRFRGLRGG